jgi:hypothetical protein
MYSVCKTLVEIRITRSDDKKNGKVQTQVHNKTDLRRENINYTIDFSKRRGEIHSHLLNTKY